MRVKKRLEMIPKNLEVLYCLMLTLTKVPKLKETNQERSPKLEQPFN